MKYTKYYLHICYRLNGLEKCVFAQNCENLHVQEQLWRQTSKQLAKC